ncbi:hypothetical protein ACIPCF_05990 [Paracoccus marcusii]|uniref:hypothetical protein n=1 Tax=Paracoccus marcusii TaxID=59779 RepID=UPI0038B99996
MFRKRLAIWLPITLVSCTVVTGVIGWSLHPGPNGARLYTDWGDVAYNTLLAFTGDGSYMRDPQANGWIKATRFLGFLTTFYAILAILAVLFGAKLARFLAGFRRNHAVMVGASRYMLHQHVRGGKVTIFDTVENLASLPEDATWPRVMKIAITAHEELPKLHAVGKPGQVLFGASEPMQNLNYAHIWLRQRADLTRPGIKLRLEDKSLARAPDLLFPDLRQAEIVSESECLARALVSVMAPSRQAILRGQRAVHILLIGMGSNNLALSEELALRTHHPNLGRLHLTILDRNASIAKRRMLSERPDLLSPDFSETGPKITFLAADALHLGHSENDDALIAAEEALGFTAIVISAGSDAASSAIAMRLRQFQQHYQRLHAPIFMRMRNSDTIAPPADWHSHDAIIRFGGTGGQTHDLALETLYEARAKALHDSWRNNDRSAQNDPAQAWENLSALQRRPNYRAAMFAFETLYAAGCVPPLQTRPTQLILHPGVGNHLLGSPENLRILAELEHERWNTERRLEGFRTAPLNAENTRLRDNEKRLHPSLVPFDALSHHEQEKDRNNVELTLKLASNAYSAATAASAWRKSLRIGLMGSLKSHSTTKTDITHILQAYFAHKPQARDYSLEILTPNAPGYDRDAAWALADAWQAIVARPAHIICFNAARLSVVDGYAKQADHGASTALTAATVHPTGHALSVYSFQPLGCSNAELAHNSTAYMQLVAQLQDHIMSLADEMIFDLKGGAHTNQARDLWLSTRKRESLEHLLQ